MRRSGVLNLQRLLPVALLSILLFTAASIAAAAQTPGKAGRGPGDGRDAGHQARGMAARLELTDAQSEAMAKIRAEGQARDVPLRKQLRQLRHELKGEMMKDEPSEKAAAGLARQMGEVRTRLQTARLQDRLAMRQLLTAEQRDKWLMMGDGAGRGGRGRMHDGACGKAGASGRGRGGSECDGTGPGPRQRQRDRDAD